jgi:hypothetical protein
MLIHALALPDECGKKINFQTGKLCNPRFEWVVKRQVYRDSLNQGQSSRNQGQIMHFEQVDLGEYRIYAGAIERPRQFGYVAAVVVMRERGRSPQVEAFRDENLASGYAWTSPAEALRFAVNAGRDAVLYRAGAVV